MAWVTFAILLRVPRTETRPSPSTPTTRTLSNRISHRYGISLAHNGNLINCDDLRVKLLCNLRCINTTSVPPPSPPLSQDSELLLNMFADELEHRIDRSSAPSGQIPKPSVSTLFDAVHATMSQVIGGYAVVVLIKGVGMLIFRDPHGIRYLPIEFSRAVRSASA